MRLVSDKDFDEMIKLCKEGQKHLIKFPESPSFTIAEDLQEKYSKSIPEGLGLSRVIDLMKLEEERMGGYHSYMKDYVETENSEIKNSNDRIVQWKQAIAILEACSKEINK